MCVCVIVRDLRELNICDIENIKETFSGIHMNTSDCLNIIHHLFDIITLL